MRWNTIYKTEFVQKIDVYKGHKLRNETTHAQFDIEAVAIVLRL